MPWFMSSNDCLDMKLITLTKNQNDFSCKPKEVSSDLDETKVSGPALNRHESIVVKHRSGN